MIPAVGNGFGCNCIPGILNHEHGLQKVNFIYVAFVGLVKLNSSKAVSTAIVSLDTVNDSCITGLNERCEIWFKILKVDILWFIFDEMARKIVNKHDNVATSISHVDVKPFDPPAKICYSSFCLNKISN